VDARVLVLAPDAPVHVPAAADKLNAGLMKTMNGKSSSIPNAPGIYHFPISENGNKKRVHLRIDADGSGVLLINASQIYHLNPSAARMAYLLLEGKSDRAVIRDISHVFDVKPKTAKGDLEGFKSNFLSIISPNENLCPVCDLEIDVLTPFSRHPSAPYRMDLALTYRCNNRCIHCYNQPDRIREELGNTQWKSVLDTTWNLGIPHVVFTGGEPTIIPFLPELVRYAENLGLITGLNTNGRKLSEKDFIDELVDAGLDHVQITLESHDEAIHDQIVAREGAWRETIQGIKNALGSDLFIMTNTTMLQINSPFLAQTLEFLAEMGVPTIGLNGLIYSGRGKSVDQGISENDLPELLDIAKTHIAKTDQRLIWYTPTMYCHFNPVESGLGVKGCTAALYNMCIEPDGAVLPCQSYYQSLGNILVDDWDAIWNHQLAVALRERKFAPAECHFCDLFDTCGAGCPLYLRENNLTKPQPVNALPF
jgi:radical SAM protein with 4Fe4S-binding SPASM domain